MREDLGEFPIDQEIKEYVCSKYTGEVRQVILDWFNDMLDDFVDQYDDEYIYSDLWEHEFLWEVSHPDKPLFVTKAKEQMLELMPNDIVYHWTELKEKQKQMGIKASNFYEAMIDFKLFVEGTVYSAFAVTEHPREEIGRTLLQTYLTPRGFREAQMSGGNSDLVYPEFETIVETKIWHGQKKFKDGVLQLVSYLKAQGYCEGYYVIFDDTKTKNAIVAEYGECFGVKYEDFLIYCIFVKISPKAPSKREKTTHKK